jgi:hypothetical protein
MSVHDCVHDKCAVDDYLKTDVMLYLDYLKTDVIVFMLYDTV